MSPTLQEQVVDAFYRFRFLPAPVCANPQGHDYHEQREIDRMSGVLAGWEVHHRACKCPCHDASEMGAGP